MSDFLPCGFWDDAELPALLPASPCLVGAVPGPACWGFSPLSCSWDSPCPSSSPLSPLPFPPSILFNQASSSTLPSPSYSSCPDAPSFANGASLLSFEHPSGHRNSAKLPHPHDFSTISPFSPFCSTVSSSDESAQIGEELPGPDPFANERAEIRPDLLPPLLRCPNGASPPSILFFENATFPTPEAFDKAFESGKNFYCCPVQGCRKAYVRKSDLKTHVINRHPPLAEWTKRLCTRGVKQDKAYGCPFPSCDSGFVRKSDLKRHLRHKHPRQVVPESPQSSASDHSG